MKNLLKTTLLLSLLPLLAACGNSQQNKTAAAGEEDLPLVSVKQVSARNVIQKETYTSTVEAFVRNNIAPQTAMRIKSIRVEVGDFVRKGQVVATMDAVNLDQAKLRYKNDSTEYFRLKGLYEVGGLSKSDLDQIELAYKVSKKSYDNMLENTVLRSPIDGVISARNYDVGDMFSMGQPIFVVQEITPVKLLAAVSERDYTRVKKGGKVSVTADAFPADEFTGTITRLYPTVDPSTHTFLVEVQVPNKDRKLRPGMFARVTIVFGTNHSVVIPDLAVVRQQGAGDRYAYVLEEDGTVSFRHLTLGVRIGDEYEVLEGVKDGEKVVVEGQLRIKDGVAVEVKQ
ncbi:MAG: efflux RND transporter periplasmic adaptor subunit [Bacteroidales bacterium]|nr:efflux RND transporter periplasmic adaptor subunit [Bacteroidales bacterium]